MCWGGAHYGLRGAREASSRGGALLALEAPGGNGSAKVAAPPGETCETNLSRRVLYKETLERQRGLYNAVAR